MKGMCQEVTSYKQIALQFAHDIASPLSVMQINLSFIKKRHPEENLSMMEAAINQMREMMFSLLGKKTLDVKIELNTIIQQIILEKKYEWKDNPCDIEFFPINKKYGIHANQSDIFRVLSNLLNNAYESLQEKRKISITLNQNKDHIILSTQDTGCGIPENKIEAVLRGDSLKINGHGIGLSSAINYVQSIGGRLELRSIENEGTEVQLFFPKIDLNVIE